MELELLTLLFIHVLGSAFFGRFESHTAGWKKVLKWVIILLITYTLYYLFGHPGSLGGLAFLLVASLSVHFIWCRRHGIHPLAATPRRKYYQLRNWEWTE